MEALGTSKINQERTEFMETIDTPQEDARSMLQHIGSAFEFPRFTPLARRFCGAVRSRPLQGPSAPSTR